MHGYGQDAVYGQVFFGPQIGTVLLLALIRMNFQQLQTGRCIYRFKSLASLKKKNQEISSMEPKVSCQ